MKPDAEYRGACLCGAVRIVAKVKSNSIGACHCGTCFKWGSGPLFAAECEASFEFDGGEGISVFSSSDWAERGFCRTCGTHLFYRLKQGGHYEIPVGLFDGDNRWVLSQQIFFDEKPSFYSFKEQTKNLTGAEVFAKYSGS